MDRITHWRHCFIDVDPIEDSANPAAVAAAIVDLLSPGTVTWVYSGRGHQLWVEVPALALRPGDRDDLPRRISSACRGFIRHLSRSVDLRGCLLDESSANVAQVARMPGTVNQATGRGTKLLAVASTLADPASVLCHEPPPESSPVTPMKLSGELSFRKVWPHLTETADRFVLCGIDKGGRHSAAYAAARCLEELGIPMPQAQGWLLTGASKCRPSLSVSDIEYITRCAYGVASKGAAPS